MARHLVSLNDLPPDGKEFDISDQSIWQDPLQNFHMDCRISSPIRAKVHVYPAENGCLVRGSISGAIIVPCNRCANDAEADIDSEFEEFEEIPAEPVQTSGRCRAGKKAAAHQQEESRVVFEQNSPCLDLDAVCWEEFMLALPFNPLCSPDCRGLCPQCGANLNEGPCGCVRDVADPRLASLRGITIKRQ